ncbi:outer membrane beta-barrel family protein [Lewinella sp. W8]|uniref:outer membrane beta-barrel family protein n=1 Tax=Lewinella sp. W8 TaxID=2528208 RepID=UPI0010683D29|nr:outer membrane beta-barrel family protein [Lewinella sp. W8]MTB50211.1 TonB-dependent receptor [Lewinella sp. W8]
MKRFQFFFFFLAALLCLAPGLLSAQSAIIKGEIRGRVVDGSNGQPLDFATVSLYSAADSSLVGGNTTQATGDFVIEAPLGEYYARVEFLVYETLTIPSINLTKGARKVDLGVIELAPEAEELAEVIVTAEKSTMQMGLDKKVFNVGKDLASQGGTASELLDNVPTLQVDVEGNLSLRGSTGVRILINGRPSGLIGSDPAAGLRSIPANMIEKVEVITNPSARYEAEGMAGIVNIVLKKDDRGGLNGSFDLIAGAPLNLGTSVNLNYRKDRFNFFVNYGLSYREGPGGGSQTNTFFRPEGTFITLQESDRNRSGINNSLRFGADYSFSDKSVLTMAGIVRRGDDDNYNETRYFDYLNDLDNPTGAVIRGDNETEEEWRKEINLSYVKTFDRKGQKFSADIRYQDDTEREGSDLFNRFLDANFDPTDMEDELQRSNNTESSDQLIFQSDYIHPFGEEGRIEVGVRGSRRNIDNDFLVEEFIDQEWMSLAQFSNDFNYDETVAAAYFIIGNKKNRFSWQVGLRPEYSRFSTRLLQTEEVNDREFLNLFPSAFVGYELPNNNTLQLSYSRRINRPRFWDLNPFFSFSDERNFRSGNPNLNPEFTDSYELSHIKIFDKGSVGSSVYYRRTNNVISRIRRVNDDNTTITMPENLLTENAYGVEVTSTYDPTKWLRLSGDFNFFRAITDGGNLEDDFSADATTWFTRGTVRVSPTKKTDIQLRFNYRAPRIVPQGRNKSLYSFDLAASQDIMKDKATLTLSVRDLLNSRRWRYLNEGVTNGNPFRIEGDFQWRVRQVSLTFNYRLNQSKKRGGNRGDRGGDYGGEGEF